MFNFKEVQSKNKQVLQFIVKIGFHQDLKNLEKCARTEVHSVHLKINLLSTNFDKIFKPFSTFWVDTLVKKICIKWFRNGIKRYQTNSI